ncbi:hypothetical protein PF003_g5405 [Phytophthora fragariae]|nr:hypothetical protein PF003_g5405 [Phytophthora fragariae]
MILQHALPASWKYIVRGWLGQTKTLSYVKLMELAISDLKRRRPEGSDQDNGKAEKAYAAVEAKPTGGTIVRKRFACKKPRHVVADCPENPNRGEKVGTPEPPKKKQNTGKQFSKKDTKRHDHRDRDHKHDDGRRHEDRCSPPRGQASLANEGSSFLCYGPPLLNTAVSHAGTGMEAQSPRIISSHVGLATVLHPQFVTNASTAIRHQDMMIVDTIHNIMPDRHRSTVMPERHSSTKPIKPHPSGLVINVDHHPDRATRHHVDQETSLRRADEGSGRPDERRGRSYDRRGDGSPRRRDSYGSPHLPHSGGRQLPKPRDEPRESGYFVSGLPPAPPRPSAAQWRTESQEGEKYLIAAHIRDKGMACIRRGDRNYEYKFDRNRTSNSVITRDDIITNINKNPKMTRSEKRLTRANVKKRFDLEARMEAKRRGFTDRQEAVRRAARAIRHGDIPANWRQVLGGSPLSPEDPYASDSV